MTSTVRRHWVCESSHWLLDAALRQDEDQNADRNRFENRAMLNKLCLSLARLMQAHPYYDGGLEGVAVHDLEEPPEVLLGVPADHLAYPGDAGAPARVGLRLTAADRRRYERILEEAEEDVW